MAILLKRNNNEDPWYGFYRRFINVGEIVKLDEICNEPDRSKECPPEIYVLRKNCKKPHLASLNCFDYVGSTK